MTTIKLNHPAVTKQLEFTSKWIDRETNLKKVFEQYIKIVQKNVEDTILLFLVKISLALAKSFPH
ncbi:MULTISPECIES: DUF5344 family protein [unclassified Peribacillus]|uniref:DUF5344 family protein n=1 Tax=unclassified Peribacillus TaxID=2675266 RepID=UPI001912E1BF|nr:MULTISPECIES: DUF5344 family protein [unclassified Peribacillus]MBK5444663.1 DUF5344 family protein [Peribacillus sp. TH24]MBK5460631.1 DUF5344 family protein [Peribacillus sp. TH27]MBK5482415.1 DUF5344 family protein [Peribacillus sp. TH16]MBK5498779.1 DUF5344 family protein [Peribacillus sp. TH14]WMX56113.1 DUF5344 family protein [Peribacillus sp. R9-11]